MIQPIQTADLPDIPVLLAEMKHESGHPGVLNPEIAVKQLRALLESGLGFGFISRDPETGEATGEIFGVETPDWLNGEMTAAVLTWYARPYDGHGLDLMRYFVSAARERGAKRVNAAHVVDYRAERMKRLFERLGFRAVETWWFKQL